MIIIDSREKPQLPGKIEREIGNCKQRMLDGGDYWIQKDEGWIIIERSKYSDFIGKIKTGRLRNQVEKCLELSDDVYFLIEGTKQYGHMSPKSIMSAVASISRHVKVVCTQDLGETFYFIEKLYKMYNTDKGGDQVGRLKPKKMSYREEAKWCLMGMRGIGGKKADKLLDNASLYELVTACKGSTDKVGSHIDKVFNAK